MRIPGGEDIAHGLHEDRDERHYCQGGQSCLFLDLIFSDVRLRADLATRVRIAAAAMALFAAFLGLFALCKHTQAIPTLQKENDGGEKNRCDASALHAHSVPDSRIGQVARANSRQAGKQGEAGTLTIFPGYGLYPGASKNLLIATSRRDQAQTRARL